MSGAAALYSPEVLALATSLAHWPLDEGLPLQGSARSKSCGSTLMLGLETDAGGRISRIGLKAQACAIGQAAAAIFAGAAAGRSGAEIALAESEIRAWLAGGPALPHWPGMATLEPAQAYSARHGAILLAWQAARELLHTGQMPR
ncbi:MAG: iron-sulfur cluster assembly scaffold protein [Novosphingobium sp.]